MASFTLRAKTAIMLIVLLVTRVTVAGRTLETGILMALGTFYFAVLPFQLESRKIVIKGGIIPIGRSMAGFTLRPKLAIVLIVLFMARIAIAGRAKVLAIRMAIFTSGLGMFTFQFEGGQVMVKFSRFPTFRRVTGSTIGAKTTIVLILCKMAGGTRLGRVLQIGYGTGVEMALRTNHIHMFARQRELDPPVIEVAIAINTIVTIQAALTELKNMRGCKDRIFLAVTIDTGGLFKRGNALGVAILAGEIEPIGAARVGSQRKAHHLVWETPIFHDGQRGVGAAMLGVTETALGSRVQDLDRPMQGILVSQFRLDGGMTDHTTI